MIPIASLQTTTQEIDIAYRLTHTGRDSIHKDPHSKKQINTDRRPSITAAEVSHYVNLSRGERSLPEPQTCTGQSLHHANYFIIYRNKYHLLPVDLLASIETVHSAISLVQGLPCKDGFSIVVF